MESPYFFGTDAESPKQARGSTVATDATTVSIEGILAAREYRVRCQKEALSCWGLPVISLTVVMPGPEKNSDLARFLLQEALNEIDALCAGWGWPVRSFAALSQTVGPEALYVVEADAQALKLALTELEETHELGRLWDMDVICPDKGSISRRDFGLDSRRCLVCEQTGHACARSRAHPLFELMNVIEKKVAKYRQCRTR